MIARSQPGLPRGPLRFRFKFSLVFVILKPYVSCLIAGKISYFMFQESLTAGQVKKLHGLGANVALVNAKSQVREDILLMFSVLNITFTGTDN